ncbi:MAG: cupin [Thioalkalispiraceae bacterium]|jgi:1,2-dihydroxy-3-keto-5-methylthiopentene dioxygenase
MTILTIQSDDGGGEAQTIIDYEEIANTLAEVGVLLEMWQADKPLSEGADQQEVLEVYRTSIDKLNERFNFKSIDVVALTPDNPSKAEFRQKFLAEHTHEDFEVRFFVEGSGLFYLHIGDKVYMVLCEAGDLISVPANTTHWFDMGVNPDFKCIRFFTTENGWEGHFTGDDIATRFPNYDEHLAALA